MSFSVRQILASRCVVESNTSGGIGYMEAVDDIFEETEIAEDYLSLVQLASEDAARPSTTGLDRDFSHVRSRAAQSVAASTARDYQGLVLAFLIRSVLIPSDSSSLALQYTAFCQEKGWCPANIQPWHLDPLDADTDFMIIAWIMEAYAACSL